MLQHSQRAFLIMLALLIASEARADGATAGALRDQGNGFVIIASAGLGYVALVFAIFRVARKPTASRTLRAVTTLMLLPFPLLSSAVVGVRVGRYFVGDGYKWGEGWTLPAKMLEVAKYEGLGALGWLAMAAVALLMIRRLWRKREPTVCLPGLGA